MVTEVKVGDQVEFWLIVLDGKGNLSIGTRTGVVTCTNYSSTYPITVRGSDGCTYGTRVGNILYVN